MIYRCLYPFLVSFLLFTSLALYAQNEPKSEDSLKVVSNNLPTKTIQIFDTITTLTNTGDFSAPVVNAHNKDSLIFDLKDESTARTADSLWMKELYDSSRFEEVYGSIANEVVEPSEYKELPTELLKQRLEELNTRTPFNVEYNPSLENIIKHYLKNRRSAMAKLMALSDYYFPMFEQELDKHNLPLEIKYLAVVESALDPVAKSRAGAKGLWQFMFTTGKMFGLEVSSYVDERADPEMSTEAAAKYLKSLHKSFNDWDLALAAYNSGPGNVSKAIRRSGGETNYWKIRNRLPRETAGYVPAFLATMYIFEFAEEHGFKSNGPKFHQIATDTIQVKRLITFEQVAKVVNLPIEEVQFLNPSYKLGIIPYIKDKNYTLRLPAESIGKFAANEEAIYALAQEENSKAAANIPAYVEQPDRIRYRVKSGDYLGKIAERHGVGVSQIKKWNGLKSNNLKVDQRLTIYPRKLIASSTKTRITKTTTKDNVKLYTVKKGDSLWSISQKYPGVTVQNIKIWNDISSNKLKPGMKLKISKG
ncbi:MAG: LysM peptidoglycan-binding domain-containing protein [Flavobacteriaceae bacterium]|jgi:membrane-bound lytic murein transglycosylase D|nr:LysM peptidoglycan-binding domain-containing protein [Flavobacteriaceae bacterium]MBT6704291.1 LysM peptidoglycan-binding domain-containing protein [Flavobacteriaceae bacterium]